MNESSFNGLISRKARPVLHRSSQYPGLALDRADPKKLASDLAD
jgi:hypothetical protein